MLTHTTSKILFNKNLLKIIAIVIAYNLWVFLASFYSISFTTTVPIVIHNPPSLIIKEKPKYATITLRGLRKHIRTLDYTQLAVHIAQQQVQAGTTVIDLSRAHLALPPCVTLIHCVPASITIVAEPKIVEINIV